MGVKYLVWEVLSGNTSREEGNQASPKGTDVRGYSLDYVVSVDIDNMTHS